MYAIRSYYELYQEPIGTKMQARNLSATETTKIIVFQVSDEGKPMRNNFV